MCLSCGCKEPDDVHGNEHHIVMQDIVNAAAADEATVEKAWRNMTEAMTRVLNGRLGSQAWTPELKRFKSGGKAPVSGQYQLVGPRGGKTGVERTVVAGEPLPPTKAAGQEWLLVDKANTSTKP